MFCISITFIGGSPYHVLVLIENAVNAVYSRPCMGRVVMAGIAIASYRVVTRISMCTHPMKYMYVTREMQFCSHDGGEDDEHNDVVSMEIS